MDVITAPKLKNIVLDATVLSTLMSCPRLADFRFNHRLQAIRGRSNSLEVGLLVHKVLEVYYWHIIHGFKREYALSAAFTAGEMYVSGCRHCSGVMEGKPECGHQPDEYPGLKNTPSESVGSMVGWKWALTTCEQYFEFYKADYWVPLEVENTKGEVVYQDDEIRIFWKAKYDWIVDTLQGVISVDHKTSKQRRNTLSLNNQFMGQCMILKTRSVMINKIGFQTTLKPEEKFQRVEVGYTADRLMEFQSEILPHYAYMYLNYVETGYWPPNFTHCETKYGDCIFVPVCESNPNMRDEAVKMEFYRGPEWNPGNIEGD